MSRVYDEADVLKTPEISNQTLPPINVYDFVKLMIQILTTIFEIGKEGATAEELKANKDNFAAYFRKLYVMVIVKGKEFKKSLSAFNDTLGAIEDSEEEKTHSYLNIKGNIVELAVRNICWAGVIKGSAEEKNLRPYIHTLEDQSLCPIVTIKLLQACVSIILVRFNIFDNLTPAPLCANIFRSCKKAESAKWSIHGHSGFNFVANFVHNIKFARKAGEDEATYNNRRMLYKDLPKLPDLMIMALRLDESNALKIDKAKKAAVGYEPYPSVKAIVQSCKLTEKDSDEILKMVDPTIWGMSSVSAAGAIAKSFAAKVALKGKVKAPEAQIEQSNPFNYNI